MLFSYAIALTLEPRQQVMRQQGGWTLLEMLVVVTLVGSLSVLTLPQLQSWRSQWQINQLTHQLQSVLHTARQEALLSRSIVTLCVLDEHQQCTSPWQQGPLAIFRDPLNERQLTGNTTFISHLDIPYPMLISRHPSIMPWLQFSPDGTPRGATGGHIRLCPTAQAAEVVRWIIAAGGRSRIEYDLGEPCTM